MSALPLFLTITALLAVNGALRAATIYADRDSFLGRVAPGYAEETFQSTNPPTYLLGTFGFTASVSGGSLYDSGHFIGNFNGANSLTLTFTTANVHAVGGNFFLSDIDDNFRSEPLTITLSDGTSDSFTPASTASFRGYVSTGPFITTLVMGVSAGSRFNNLDNLIFGNATPVPESATSGFLFSGLDLPGASLGKDPPGSAVFREAALDERFDGGHGGGFILAFGGDGQLGTESRRKHHQAHDTLAVYLFIILLDPDLALVGAAHLHKHGGRTGVESELVGDSEFSREHMSKMTGGLRAARAEGGFLENLNPNLFAAPPSF
jgi:hypothetical protein